MHLTHLSLRNFRGIRRLELPLDRTTVLLGENSLGKSNLLDALALVLAPDQGDELPALSPDDLHVPADGQPAESLLIGLTFDEPGPDAWDGVVEAALMDRARRREDGSRRLVLEVHGTAAGSRPAATWFLVDEQGRPLDAAPVPGLLAALRRAAPFVLLGGAPYDPRRPSHPPGDDGPPPSRRQRLIADLYRRLTSYSGPPDPAEVDAAVDAVRADLAARAPAPPQAAPWPFVTAPERHPRESHPSAAAAHVAAWLLVGRLLDHLGPRRPPFPIVAIEDAEAHLHPVLLASVWRLLTDIPAQKIVTTNAPELAGAAPLEALRRLTRTADGVDVRRVPPGLLDAEARRRVAYHLRVRRGGALFARAWLLVEGETEFWLLPELARQLGDDLAAEGVAVVEFAQCGVDPLIQVADALAIPWHLLVDGDGTGRGYAAAARRLEGRGSRGQAPPITVLPAEDMEHTLWEAGYEHVYREHAPLQGDKGRRARKPAPGYVISRAVRATSKPFLALAVAEAAADPQGPGVPEPLGAVLHDVVARARAAASPAPSDPATEDPP